MSEAGLPGLAVLIGTAVVGLSIVFVAVIVAERFARAWTPFIIVGFVAAVGILMDYSSVRFGGVRFGSFEMIIAVGVMMWPLLFLAMDYLNEFYGPKMASYAVFAMGVGKVAVGLATVWILLGIPNPISDPDLLERGETFNSLMALSPRLNIVSIIAALAAGLANVWIFNKLHRMTQGRHLWVRNNVSSMSSLLVDSIVFNFGAFLFVLPFDLVLLIAVESLVIYWTTNIIDTAFIYSLRYIKRNGLLGVTPVAEQEALVVDLRPEIRAAHGTGS